MADKEHFDKLSSFMQQQGFVWGPAPEIYGGLAGFYTYGPLGKLLKNNVEATIRDVFQDHNFMEVEAPTIMPASVWEASGHLSGFTDPLIEDTEGNVYRADNLIEDYFDEHDITRSVPVDEEKILETIEEFDLTAPSGNDFIMEIKQHNLMMKTTVGVDQEAYNRPETATTTYLPFRNYDFFFRSKYPFGVFQIGQAYRNEISPRKHLLRKREFTQAEAQLFILPEQKNGYEQYDDVQHTELPMWTWEQQDNGEPRETMRVDDVVGTLIDSEAYAWTLVLAYNLFREMGIPEERMRVRQHGPDEKAFYARDAWDIEIKTTSFGWAEVCGVHDRTDYDLSQHTEHGHETLETNQEGEKITPHILEIAFGTDRPTFALLDIFYDYQEEDEGKTTFRVPYHMAPRKVAVFPLHRKDHLKEKAHDVHDMIKHEFNAKYDETASIGKRYLRASQEGIPYCVTVDYETVEEDPDTVTVRDRETEDQIRVEVDDLQGVLRNLFDGASFERQGDIV